MKLEKLERNKWLIALAAVGIHISIGSVYAWSVLVNPIMLECQSSLTAVTFIFSVAILFLGIGASTFSKYVDKYGPRKTGLFGTLLFVIGYFLSAFAIYIHSIPLLYLSYGVFVGCATGILYVTPVSTLVKYFYKTPGVSGAIAISGFGIAATVASPIMNYLVDRYGLIDNFLILGVCYGILMLASALYLKSPKNQKELKKILQNEPNIKPNKVYKSWQFKALFLTFFINIGCGIAILSLLSPMMQSDFGFTAVEAASFVGLAGIANCTGRFIWASLSDVTTRPNMYVMFAGMGALMYLGISTITNLFVFEICILTIISFYGGYFSAMPAYLQDIWGKKYLSTIHGRVLFAWGIAGISTPCMLSLCKDLTGSYTIMLYAFIVGMLINLCILLKLRKNVLETKKQI